VTTSPTFRRARSAENKAQRREAILTAAAQLAARDGVRQVTLTDIAAAVGMHKSALLRYFETREQIFLELTGSAWREWAAAVRAELGSVVSVNAAPAVAAVLAREFATRPLLCDLIPHTALNLERHASIEAVRAYKLTSLGAVEDAASAVAGPLPDLAAEDRRQLISTLALLAGAMYQIATPPAPLAELYATDPNLGHALLDLEPRLARAAQVTIAGLQALPTAPPPAGRTARRPLRSRSDLASAG
jgi:AcrR family transcriptional regulator